MPVLRNARATSAGGVIYRRNDGRVEVALAHRRRPSVWALPKGTPDSGETIEETALRETREETGLQVELVAPVDAIRYFFVHGSVRYHKTVHFYLMRPTGGDVSLHDHEFDEVRWVQLEEALSLLNYPTERAVLNAAAALIETLEGAAAPASARA